MVRIRRKKNHIISVYCIVGRVSFDTYIVGIKHDLSLVPYSRYYIMVPIYFMACIVLFAGISFGKSLRLYPNHINYTHVFNGDRQDPIITLRCVFVIIMYGGIKPLQNGLMNTAKYVYCISEIPIKFKKKIQAITDIPEIAFIHKLYTVYRYRCCKNTYRCK